MNRIPEPEQTPHGPAYEGRVLDRIDEEVVDQGAPFDIRTLITRRGLLSVLGIGVAGAALAACGSTSGSAAGSATSASGSTAASDSSGLPTGEIPDETAGPYPGDGSNGPDILAESGIVRSDIRTSLNGGTTADGVPMTLELTILDMANDDAPFANAAVYVWHCDREGRYSMYSEGVENETYLRGVQVADENGKVTFSSIFPACYSGRWPHIHFEVYPDADSITDSSNAIATSQVALTEEASTAVYALSDYSGSQENLSQVSLAGDNVFGEDSAALQLATITGDPDAGYAVSLVARVDTGTTPSGGGQGGGPSGGGGPGGNPPAGGPSGG